MSKGMIIQCGGCGFSRFVNLEGDFNAREAELNICLNDPSRCRLEDVNRRGEKPKVVNP